MNLDDKLAKFEGLPRYTIGKTEYISQGAKAYNWFAKEFKKEIMEVVS